jgi:hypothetical protein
VGCWTEERWLGKMRGRGRALCSGEVAEGFGVGWSRMMRRRKREMGGRVLEEGWEQREWRRRERRRTKR